MVITVIGRTILCCLLTLFTSLKTVAQVKQNSKIQNTFDTNKDLTKLQKIKISDTTVDIRETLVKLALRDNSYDTASHKVTVNGYQTQKARGEWLRILAVQGNLNEFALNGLNRNANAVSNNSSTSFPKYNFGMTVPGDLYTNISENVKIAKLNAANSEAEKSEYFRQLKMKVLGKYEDYLFSELKLNIQSQLTQDAKTAYFESEKNFQKGLIENGELNKKYKSYMDEKIKQVECLRNCNVIKMELEMIIGSPLDSLLK